VASASFPAAASPAAASSIHKFKSLITLNFLADSYKWWDTFYELFKDVLSQKKAGEKITNQACTSESSCTRSHNFWAMWMRAL
jgi:hypothetical protein